jgi:lipoic acid synthetase
MVGLGEKTEEVIAAMEDLKEAGCGLLTLGQYLQPGEGNIPVERFVLPEEFKEYEETALGLGFKAVKAGTFVRSSYLAEVIHRDVLISLTEDES